MFVPPQVQMGKVKTDIVNTTKKTVFMDSMTGFETNWDTCFVTGWYGVAMGLIWRDYLVAMWLLSVCYFLTDPV